MPRKGGELIFSHLLEKILRSFSTEGLLNTMEVRDLRIQETTPESLPSVPTANTLFSIASLISSSHRSPFSSRPPGHHHHHNHHGIEFPFPHIDVRAYYETLQRNVALSGGLNVNLSVTGAVSGVAVGGDRVLDLSTSSTHILPDIDRSSRDDDIISRGM